MLDPGGSQVLPIKAKVLCGKASSAHSIIWRPVFCAKLSTVQTSMNLEKPRVEVHKTNIAKFAWNSSAMFLHFLRTHDIGFKNFQLVFICFSQRTHSQTDPCFFALDVKTTKATQLSLVSREKQVESWDSSTTLQGFWGDTWKREFYIFLR